MREKILTGNFAYGRGCRLFACVCVCLALPDEDFVVELTKREMRKRPVTPKVARSGKLVVNHSTNIKGLLRVLNRLCDNEVREQSSTRWLLFFFNVLPHRRRCRNCVSHFLSVCVWAFRYCPGFQCCSGDQNDHSWRDHQRKRQPIRPPTSRYDQSGQWIENDRTARSQCSRNFRRDDPHP